MTRPAHRRICIHGHFYQPPRENPWLEAVVLQDSAHPYHDWNERISAECYGPNADSRILDDAGRITRIVNNYGRISFNFGPTLLSWLERHDSATYRAILSADALSRERYSGHGSAMAQVYNHAILPLANLRDKQTQVRWGIRDFERRFGRRPQGMWLPETAADRASLEVLAGEGIRFTLLSPRQAARTRTATRRNWIRCAGGDLDTTRPYVCRLPAGAEIALFFYDGPISQAVAFERLLSDGHRLADRLIDAAERRGGLVHIATDGETYGHHHRHGDMALAAALERIEQRQGVSLTNYGEYLELRPAVDEVEIAEPAAWSCAHGVGRWSEACGCNSGGRPEWNQEWRKPLREALIWLRDRLTALFEASAPDCFADPWAARDGYIDVVLDRSDETIRRFLLRFGVAGLDAEGTTRALKLMELQRHAQLMFTSCGWFFDEVSGIETVQILQYAARAQQLAGELYGLDLETPLLDLLQRAPSNLPEYGNAARLYRMKVPNELVDLAGAAANAAASLLFGEDPARELAAGFNLRVERCEVSADAAPRWTLGELEVGSITTRERRRFCFCFVHPRALDLLGGVRESDGSSASFRTELLAQLGATAATDWPGLIEARFPLAQWRLDHLLRGVQRRIVHRLTGATLRRIEDVFEELFREHESLLLELHGLDLPPPRPLRAAAEQVLNRRLRESLLAEPADPRRWRELRDRATAAGAALDDAQLRIAAQTAVERIFDALEQRPRDAERVELARQALDWIVELPFEVDLRRVENRYYRMQQDAAPDRDEPWRAGFRALGRTLRFAP